MLSLGPMRNTDPQVLTTQKTEDHERRPKQKQSIGTNRGTSKQKRKPPNNKNTEGRLFISAQNKYGRKDTEEVVKHSRTDTKVVSLAATVRERQCASRNTTGQKYVHKSALRKQTWRRCTT